MVEINKEENNQSSKSNETEQLKKELEISQKLMEEYLDGWKRAKADYINFKKESEKKTTEIVQFANASLIIQLLPIFGNFKIALQHIPQDVASAEWAVGFTHIKSQFVEFLKGIGIEEIKTVGQKFDPNFHEAVVSETREGCLPDIIFEEIKPGYTLYGKVIQPARVKVAK